MSSFHQVKNNIEVISLLYVSQSPMDFWYREAAIGGVL